jgi:hypothetical protein
MKMLDDTKLRIKSTNAAAWANIVFLLITKCVRSLREVLIWYRAFRRIKQEVIKAAAEQ